MQWTHEQQEAIDNRGGSLLVSAAAGSGKTAVLVERVLSRITDAEHPCDIDSFLIVTYTKAAANKLRMDLASALSKRLATNPDNTHLRRQLFLIHQAQITTVHSFCLSLIKNHFHVLGLPPEFRIADEVEIQTLFEETLENVLEEQYAQGDANFLALSDLFSTSREDARLQRAIIDTYRKIQSHAHPTQFLETIRAQYISPSADIETTQAGHILLDHARVQVAFACNRLQRAICEMESDDLLACAYLPIFQKDLANANALLSYVKAQKWDDAVCFLDSITFDRLGSTRGYEDKNFLDTLKKQREIWKETVKHLQKNVLCATQDEILADHIRLAPPMVALIDTVLAFSAQYMEEKRRKKVLEFSDLEHFAVHLLYESTEQTSAIAKTISAQYTEVLVDEYQDTNAVQDAIFKAVSEDGKKLFMVGDVKQSIYMFRLANPYIFLQKYLKFAPYQTAQEGQARKVVLSKNFRSRASILDTTNSIFQKVMRPEVGDVDYREGEMLYLGADYYDDTAHPRYQTELCLIDHAQDLENDQNLSKRELEAEIVARRIHSMIQDGFLISSNETTERDGKEVKTLRPVQASDFTILLRSIKGRADIYASALARYGIDTITERTDGLLATTEVRTIVALLQIIDNPIQDIELIAVLRSPLFSWSEDRLATVRAETKEGSFYEAIEQASANEIPYAKKFLNQLAQWRTLANDVPVWQMLSILYKQTNALAIFGAMPQGKKRQQHLLSFLERAKAYEENGHRGLFSFLVFLRRMLERGQDFKSGNSVSKEQAVTIMSIHKSKGLDFPVVILADCSAQFNQEELKDPVLIHSELGFGAKCRIAEQSVQYPSIERLAIAVKMKQEQINEELRLLYVALTRAKEKLILVCSIDSESSNFQKWCSFASEPSFPTAALQNAKSYTPWILLPLMQHPQAKLLRDLSANPIHVDHSMSYDLHVDYVLDNADSNLAQKDSFSLSEGTNTCEYSNASHSLPSLPALVPYPHPLLKDIPSKVTATSLKTGWKADETKENTKTDFHPSLVFRKPFFQKEDRPATPQEIGTAHHLFMQFANDQNCTTLEGITKECVRLTQNHILSAEQIALVDPSCILAFFTDPFYQNLLHTGFVRHEFKFSVLAPATRFFPIAQQTPKEQVLLQGVIDCLIEIEQGFYVIDFKTDRVTPKTLKTRSESYRAQLNTYAVAVESIFEKPVLGKYLYFFSTKSSYELTDTN